MFTLLLLIGILPILILVPLNALLIRKLWKNRLTDTRNVTYMILLTLVVFVVLRLPLTIKNIVIMYLVYRPNAALQSAIDEYASPALLTIFMINPAINLALYCFAGSDFRQRFKEMLKEWRDRVCPRA